MDRAYSSMATVESLEIPLGITVILLTIYTFSSLYPFSTKVLPWIQSYFPAKKLAQVENFSLTTSEDEGPVVERASPYSASWWSDEKTYQLERRAIFSKTWHYAAHTSSFTKPGDYLTISVSSHSIFVILGKDRKLRAFHNVCRHRAYEVTRKECGSSTVLGCRYHGWSYDTMGRLIKAPEFDGVKGFHKEKNGLWEIGVKVLVGGIVLINFDSEREEHDKVLLEKEKTLKKCNVGETKKVGEFKIEGEFNWKLGAAAFTNVPELNVILPAQGIFSHMRGIIGSSKPQMVNIFPLTTLHFTGSSKTWLAIKLIPETTTKTTIQCFLYSAPAKTSAEFEVAIEKLKAAVQTKLNLLETLQKKVVESNASLSDEEVEKQDIIRAQLSAHLKLERVEGREVNPAARQQIFSKEGQEDDDLCRQLEKGALEMQAVEGVGSEKGALGKELEW